MGNHYVNGALVGDGVLDASRPEVLIYEASGGGLKLVGVEFVVIADTWLKDHVGQGAFKSIDGGQHWSPMTARTGRRPANTGSHLEPISCCWLRPRRLVSNKPL